jgi:hypothetical protein
MSFEIEKSGLSSNYRETNLNRAEQHTQHTQHTEHKNIQLVEVFFTDGKSLKNFFSFLNKLHHEILLEFYEGGILSITMKVPEETINMSSGITKGTSYSSLRICSKNLLQYDFNKSALSYIYNTKEENLFFSLKIQTRDMISFLDTIKATTSVSLCYVHSLDKNVQNKLRFRNDDNKTETLIDVLFERQTKNDLPFFDNITSDNICPFIKIPVERFTTTLGHMTKLKEQCNENILIDLYNGQFLRKIHIHSLKEKFYLKYPTGEINRTDYLNSPPISHSVDPKLLKIIALFAKFNSRGFVEIYSVNNILRISTHISHFAEYDIYIIT